MSARGEKNRNTERAAAEMAEIFAAIRAAAEMAESFSRFLSLLLSKFANLWLVVDFAQPLNKWMLAIEMINLDAEIAWR